jgi:galactarate dehydratase
VNAALAAERRLLQQHAQDNVAIAVQAGGLPAGTVLAGGLVLRDAVPQAHKVALQDIPAGAPVRRYGVAIAHALRDIAAGSWVHERLLQPLPARELQGLPMATAVPPAAPPLQGHSFQGYRNPDGSVGTRNLLAISTTVQCVAGVLDVALQRIRSELLPRFPHVDGVVGLEHAYGCGVAINAPGAEIPIRTLRHLAMNPNFGGEVMLLGLGCEKLQPELLLPPGSLPLHTAQTLSTLRLQDPQHVGFGAMVEHLVQSALPHLERLNARRRSTVPASALVVGVQCGGSDAFSGLTANPAVGHCTDLLLRAGATVLFSETTEVRDAIAQLTARAR